MAYGDTFHLVQFSMSFYFTTLHVEIFKFQQCLEKVKQIRPADDKKLDQFETFESLRTWKY